MDATIITVIIGLVFVAFFGYRLMSKSDHKNTSKGSKNTNNTHRY